MADFPQEPQQVENPGQSSLAAEMQKFWQDQGVKTLATSNPETAIASPKSLGTEMQEFWEQHGVKVQAPLAPKPQEEMAKAPAAEVTAAAPVAKLPAAFGGEPAADKATPPPAVEAETMQGAPEAAYAKEPLTAEDIKAAGRFAAGVNKPVLTALHGYARQAEEGMALPYRVVSGDWESQAPGVISKLTGALKEVGAPEELVKDQGSVSKFVSGLVGGLASYMIPGVAAKAFGYSLPMATTLQKFGSNLITFGATDVAEAVGAGGGGEEARNALLKSIPTAALFTVAQAIPFNKLVENPWLAKALESVATGTAFTGGALIGGERDPEALAVSFLTGAGLHLMTSGLPQRKMTAAEHNKFTQEWREQNLVTGQEWDQVQDLLKKTETGQAEASPEEIMSLFKTPQPEQATPEARREAIFGGPLAQTIEGQPNRADAVRALVPQIGDHARAERFYDLYQKGDVDAALKEFPEHSAWATQQQKQVVPAPMVPGGYEVMTRATEPTSVPGAAGTPPGSTPLPGGAASPTAPGPAKPEPPAAPMGVPGGTAQDVATKPVKAPAPEAPPEIPVAPAVKVAPVEEAATPTPKAAPVIRGKGSNPTRAMERWDTADLLHSLGGIDPKYFKDYAGTPEERKKLARLVGRNGGFAPDTIYEEAKSLYPDHFGQFENADDMMQSFKDGRYERNLNHGKIQAEIDTREEEHERERQKLGLSPAEFEQLQREVERDVSAETAPGDVKAERGGGPGETIGRNAPLEPDSFFDYPVVEEPGPIKYRLAEAAFGLKSPEKPQGKFEKRLQEISAAYPDVDPEKAAQILRAQPGLSHQDVALLSRLSPEEVNQVARGNLSATEREQLFKKATDLGQQQALPGLGKGGLFDKVSEPQTVVQARQALAQDQGLNPEKLKFLGTEQGLAWFNVDNPNDPRHNSTVTRKIEEVPPAAVTTETIQKAFGSKAQVTQSTLMPDVHEVLLPNGKRILVRQNAEIQVAPEALAAYGKTELAPGEAVTGEWRSLNGTNLLSLAKGEGAEALHHEAFHGAMEMALTKGEREAILKKYGTEEAAAAAYETWKPKEEPHTLFQKILDFFRGIYQAFFPDAESAFAKVRSGEIWERVGTEPVPGEPGKFRVTRDQRTPEERAADKEVRKAAGIPSFKDFKAELDKDGEALYQRLIAPGSREIPLYEGERYYGNRAGNMIVDANGKLVTLSKKQIWERFYDPQQELLPAGTETPRDPRVAPEGTVEPPPNRTILRSTREKFAASKISEKSDLTHVSIVEHLGWAAREMAKATQILDKYSKRFARMGQEELLGFTDAVESGQTHTLPADLQEAAQAWRRLSDGLHFLVADVKGGEFAYWKDYFPRLFKNPEQAQIAIEAYLKSRGRSLTGPEGFGKPRSQLLFSDSIKSKEQGGLGLEPLDPNYVNMMKANIWEKLRYLTGQYIKQDMIEAGFLSRERMPGWVEVQDKSLKGYYAHPDAAKVLDNHLSAGLRGDPLFEIYNTPATFINTVLVGASAFHATFSVFSDLSHGVGSNLTRALGAALTGRFGTSAHYFKELGKAVNEPGNILRGGKLIQEYLKPGTHPEYAAMVDLMTQGGIRINSEEFSQMGRSFAEALRDSKLTAAGKLVHLASKPIMNWLVPRIKINAIARRLTMELDRAHEELGRNLTKDEQVKIAQQVARDADNIFGQMVYDNLSMTRGLRDALRVLIGFPGWNIGSFTKILQVGKGGVHLLGEAGRAGTEILHGRKPAWEKMDRTQRMSMEFYLGMAMVMTVAGAITNRLLTGEWPGNAKDVFMPRTGGTLPNGEAERVRFPTYLRDVLGLSHPLEMAKHKLNFPLRMFSDFAANQDYFGTQIYDPWATTGEQAKQVGQYMGKGLLPFGIQGYMKTDEPRAKALNLIGITPVPREYTNTPAMNIIDEYNKLTRASTTTKEGAERKQLKSDLLKMAREQDQIGFQETAAQAVEEGRITKQQIKEIVKESQEPPGLSRFTKLPLEWALRTWDAASDAEKEGWQPYFLKKIMREKPENLIRLREPVVAALEEMGLTQAALAISDLTLPEGGGGIDLSALGIQGSVPQMGDMGAVDAALSQILGKNLQKMTAPATVRKKKKNPFSVLGL
jgi:hypothetical protein